MAINIKPDISLSAKPPAVMSLPEIVSLARGAQAYQREQEIFPELVKQAQIQTRTAETGEKSAAFTFDQKQSDAIMNIVGGYRNDPRVVSITANNIHELRLQLMTQKIYPNILIMSSRPKLGHLASKHCKPLSWLHRAVKLVFSAVAQQLLQPCRYLVPRPQG